jgi:CBS domain-containing protein
MSVGRLCIRDVDTASGEESALVAARRMRDRSVGTLIVVNDRNEPTGLLSDRDLALRIIAQERDPALTPLAEVMTAVPVTILESSSIESALGSMWTGHFRRMPVVNGTGALVGIIALDDILTLLAEELSMVGTLLGESPRIVARRPRKEREDTACRRS